MIFNIILSKNGMCAAFMAWTIDLMWTWINFFQLILVVLLLIPNVIYAVKCGGEENLCNNKWMNVLEQVGRYGSMFFMIIYVGRERSFDFHSVSQFLVWGFGSAALLLAYWIVWMMYFRVMGIGLFAKREASAVFVAGNENVRRVAVLNAALVALPSCLFLLCGITLRYIPLMVTAVLFAVGHSYVSRENWKKRVVKNIHTKE